MSDSRDTNGVPDGILDDDLDDLGGAEPVEAGLDSDADEAVIEDDDLDVAADGATEIAE
jgi:hypothetical protein